MMLAAALKLRFGAIPSLLQRTSVSAYQPVSLATAAWQRWLATNISAADPAPGQISAKLCESRGVLRLYGEDVHPFLNVSRHTSFALSHPMPH